MARLTYPGELAGTSVDRTTGERRATIGAGSATFEAASEAVLRWEVKTRAGFRLSDARPVAVGQEYVIRLGVLREEVQVVRVVREPRRRGFAYGTLPRHPLIGKEAFLVEWNVDDSVELVIRSFSRPNGFWWALLWPVMQVARQVFIRRYLRALLD